MPSSGVDQGQEPVTVFQDWPRKDAAAATQALVPEAIGLATESRTKRTGPNWQSSFMAPGLDAAFSAYDFGAALTNQWWFDDSPIPEATSPNLGVAEALPGDHGGYFLIVSNPLESSAGAVTPLSLNNPPIPASPVLERFAEGGVKKRSVEFLGTDPDGDSIELISVDSPSQQGGAVGIFGAWVVYSPPTGYIGPDSFGFSVQDSHGAASSGNASVTMRSDSPAESVNGLAIGDGSVRLRANGIPGRNYTFQYLEGISNWIDLASVAADQTGRCEYFDHPPGGAARMYRVTVATGTDASAPVISNVGVTILDGNTVRITWQTDEPATSQVDYGMTASYGQSTTLDATPVTSHSQILSGLALATTYHFLVRSQDAASNSANSTHRTFTTLPTVSGFQSEILVTGFDFPTTLEFLPDGSMLVGELTGKIKRVLPGATQAETAPFMQIINIGSAGGLQGLMDIELDPNFAANGFFYVFYTHGTPNVDRVSRFTSTGVAASLASEVVIWQDPAGISGTDHHGGALVFGNDGKLYVTVGEHFVADNAQNLSNPRGKVLRLNADGTVPTDNPFYDGAGPNYDAIWAYGFRNPFRMSVDRPTGQIIIADVGGNNYEEAREEVNLLVRGANYGWPNCEGACPPSDAGDPIFDYSHFVPGSTTQTRDASITGGFIYRGSQFPAEYAGNYFYADYTQNWIRRLTFDQSGQVSASLPFEPADGSLDGSYGAVVHLIEGPDGAVYYTDIGWENESVITGGKIRRIRYNLGNQAPVSVATGAPVSGATPPLTVNFSGANSYDPEGQNLVYAWDFGDGTGSSQANPTHIYTARGRHTVRLQVSDGVLNDLSDPLFIQVGIPPQATIQTPSNGATFRAGDVISFSGTASDADGGLSETSYSWQVFFHHNTHVHPTLPFNGTSSGTFFIEDHGHDYSGNTRYEIVLTITDSDGLQSSSSVFIYPEKVNLSFDTAPTGLKLQVDGIDRVTPFVLDTLLNFQHSVSAPSQTVGVTDYAFGSWSDGGTQTHTLTVPPAPQSYIASFTGSISLSAGMIAHWKFDQTSGTSVADSSGNNHPLNLANGPTFVSGKYGNSISLDGTNDYGDAGDLDTSAVSVSMWIKQPQALGGWGSLVMKRRTYGFEAIDTTVNWSIGNGQGWNGVISAPITLNQWEHFVGVFDGNTMALFKNGVPVGNTTAATIANSDVPLLLGSWSGTDEFFQGQIDDVRIYNRALNADEATALFQLSFVE